MAEGRALFASALLRGVPRNATLLMAARFARSIGQGALVVDFALYLKALHWHAGAIGAVLGGSLLFGAMLTLAIGPLSDRVGRKAFLLIYETTQILAALAGLFSAQARVLATAAVIGGFGRGANGAAGPFGPVEQAWLAQGVAPERRGQVFSLNAAGGFLGMGLGALLAGLPRWLVVFGTGAAAYRVLFLVVLAGSLICVALILRARDSDARPARRDAPLPLAHEDEALRQHENGLLLRLFLVNALNGAGIGLTGPLISYWFAVRYAEGPGTIGPMMCIVFLLTSISALAAGWLTRQIGIVRAVVAMRLAGLALLVALPFSPSFGIAAVLYGLRSMLNRGTAGARSALNVSLVRPSRRGLAASVGNISVQVPRALGPVLGGVLFQQGFLILPFLVGACFQAGYVYLYGRFFRASDPGRRS